MNRHTLIFPLAFLLSFSSSGALAWGERGHDLVTRVAVQRLVDITDNNDQITRPFQFRDHMLGHLSNVPDIVWKASYMSKQDQTTNYPTHFINLDRIYPKPANVYELQRDFEKVKIDARAKGFDAAADLGSAPWRVVQLHQLMVSSLQQASSSLAKNQREQFIAEVNQALLYGGIMSHFVGDLANPHHTSMDHDGRMTGNGGLHAYFESAVVSALPMTLAAQVMAKAELNPLRNQLLSQYNDQQQKQISADASLLTFALMTESHQSLPRLVALDDQFSLITRAKDESSRAVRKPVAAVLDDYEDFAVERLALGAEVLAQLWLLAWQQAGEPDLSSYHSYEYPVKPDFIEPDYL